ncbi:MAG: hypothetical protein ACRDTT_12165 [Pseudonocardiaceae bacterium]
MTDDGFQALSQNLLYRLAESGELTPDWSDTFAAVARHQYLPDTIWVTDGAGLVPLRRSREPQEWLRRAYGPAAVITQVDDVHYQPHTRTYPIHQSGPRNLWDEIETAYHWWCGAGRPGLRRWRITTTPEGQQVTLAQAGIPPVSQVTSGSSPRQ